MPETWPAHLLPRPFSHAAWWWERVREERLYVQGCRACGARQLYPRGHCVRCWSAELEEVPATGRGRLHSHTITRRHGEPALGETYVYALVDLDEGPRLTTMLVDVDPDRVEPGMPVRVAFREVAPDVTLPMFAPAADAPERAS